MLWYMTLTFFICGDANYHQPKHTIPSTILIWNVSQTYIDSYCIDDDPQLNSQYFTLIRAENPPNFKRNGVSIYFKEHLDAHPVNSGNLNEHFVLEINIQNKKGNITSLYQSPSQRTLNSLYLN